MISVVIPTLNEAESLGPLLDALAAEPEAKEMIVVDGGSRDGTTEIARGRGAHLIACGPGRGQQLACGAEAALGEALLFLHADTRFPKGGLAAIERALAECPERAGGNFRLLFDGGTPFDCWLAGFYAWFRRHGLYYGDSGIFVRRHVYQELGGIRPLPIMEDYDFSRRLERARETCCIEAPPLVTSSRRFRGRSRLAIVYGWLKIHLLYHLGIPPTRLARIYEGTAPWPGARLR